MYICSCQKSFKTYHEGIINSSSNNDNDLKMCSPPGLPRCRWVCSFIRFWGTYHCLSLQILPTCLFRAVLECFRFLNGARSVQISLLIQIKLLEGSVIMDYGLTGKLFWLWICFFTNTHLDCVLFVCIYQLFGLSFWRHPFTAEDPLVSKWCKATFLQIWWRNKLVYILDDPRVKTFSAHFPI